MVMVPMSERKLFIVPCTQYYVLINLIAWNSDEIFQACSGLEKHRFCSVDSLEAVISTHTFRVGLRHEQLNCESPSMN